MTDPTVGVVGLGNIGGAIAANLAADGLAPTLADLDVGSVAEVAAASHVTFTSLPTPEVVTDVAAQWSAAAAPGSILVDLSTNLPEGNRRLAVQLAASGHRFVEAPLTGGAIGARNRTLVFLVGGEADAVAEVTPVLDRLGRATFHLGPVGAGSAMKLANSLVAFAATWSSLEALSLATAEGVDLRTAVEVVRTGGASNFFIDRVVDGLDERDRPVQFALELAAKDAHLMGDLAAAHDVPVPVAAALAEVLDDAVARGFGRRDWSDLVGVAEARGRPTAATGASPLMGRVPIEEGYFTVPDDPADAPRLLGSRCPACGEHFFPRRQVCARCLHDGCDPVELGPTGTLWTWTYVHVPLFAKRDVATTGYGVGQVDLPEGPRVQALLVGGPDDFAIGMEMVLGFETLRTDDDGNDVVIMRFAPATAP